MLDSRALTEWKCKENRKYLKLLPQLNPAVLLLVRPIPYPDKMVAVWAWTQVNPLQMQLNLNWGGTSCYPNYLTEERACIHWKIKWTKILLQNIAALQITPKLHGIKYQFYYISQCTNMNFYINRAFWKCLVNEQKLKKNGNLHKKKIFNAQRHNNYFAFVKSLKIPNGNIKNLLPV